LIDYIVPSASYFLGVSILLAQSLTMLFAIFCPLYLHPSIRHPPPALGHTVRVTRTEHHRVNITGTTMNESTIYNEDEIYHDAVIEHLGGSINTSNHTTPDKSVHYPEPPPPKDRMISPNGGDDSMPQSPHETALAPIVESSSEMKDSSASLSIIIQNDNNNNNNSGFHQPITEDDEEEEEATV
jgi:hypothetical protein